MKNKTKLENIVDDIVNQLNALEELDGETTQCILERIGMDDQMHRQLVMSRPISNTEILLEEKRELGES